MVGKARLAWAPALVAFDCGRDSLIGCAGLGRSIKAFNVGNLSDDISEMACVDEICTS
jgi:hypothetical protein